MAKKASTKPSYAERVAGEFVERIQNGTAPWQKPWQPGVPSDAPYNASTGNPYHGSNRLWLSMAQSGSDPRWVTYKQAQDMGAQVRKGEKGTQIQYWITEKNVAKRDENGKVVKDENGETVKEKVSLDKPFPKTATVFNADQVDGLPERKLDESIPEWERHDAAERILEGSGADIHHDQGDRAFYRPSTDSIHLPSKDQFESADLYYATALHELGHWTGHESRLDRGLEEQGGFGSEGYAREELRAEIASYMVGQDTGIGHDPDRHASYVGSWVKALEDDPHEIFRAAKDAEKISSYVQGLALDKDQTYSDDYASDSCSVSGRELESEPEPAPEPDSEPEPKPEPEQEADNELLAAVESEPEPEPEPESGVEQDVEQEKEADNPLLAAVESEPEPEPGSGVEQALETDNELLAAVESEPEPEPEPPDEYGL